VSQPNLYELPVWEDFEQRVVEVFTQGLNALATKTTLPLQEDFLSRELHKCCREANHRLRKGGRGVEYILAQVTNQPLPDDEYRAKRLEKRPDLACGYHDDSLPDDAFEEADYFYTVECKRLGSPSSASWVLNRNYVKHGIARFDHPDWGYAEGSSSGMMVGFMQTNDFAPDVVEELTSALKGLGKRKLTAAECGQVAVNLRRSLELLANVLSASNPERLADVQSMPGPQQEKYKQLLWRYLDDQFPNNYYVGKDIEHELKNVDTLLNKGVHEHWLMTMIRPLAIRTVLVMNSLLFPVKAGVVQLRVGDDLFR